MIRLYEIRKNGDGGVQHVFVRGYHRYGDALSAGRKLAKRTKQEYVIKDGGVERLVRPRQQSGRKYAKGTSFAALLQEVQRDRET